MNKPIPARGMVLVTPAAEALVESTAAFVTAILPMSKAALTAKSAPDLPRATTDMAVTAAKTSAESAPRTTAGFTIARDLVAEARTTELDRC